MFFKDIFAAALLATQATATIYYAGVAESSGEFGVYSMSMTLSPALFLIKLTIY